MKIDTGQQGLAFTTQTDLISLSNDIHNTQGRSGSSVDLTAMNQLLSTNPQAFQQAFSLSQAQFGTLQGFAPLLEGRLLGSFATGVDRVPKTGPYLLHRDEMVLSDPSGPFSNRAAATVQTAQGPVQIDLHFEGDSGKLVKLVDARINDKALQVVSTNAGQRARLLSGVRRH